MKEHPILFSGEMVKAILEGRKTQTRRVIRPQPKSTHGDWRPFMQAHFHGIGEWILYGGETLQPERARCPYGVIGDRLWVRETFWGLHDTEWDEGGGSSIDHGSDLSLGKEFHSGINYVASPESLNPPGLKYQQTIIQPENENIPGGWWLAPPNDWDGESEEDHKKRGEWIFLPWDLYTKHPSIHMPRWASRILLEVVDVRVERVQEMCLSDAIAEGMIIPKHVDHSTVFRRNFQITWDSLNAKRGYGWESNPWVWVIDFKVLAT